MIGVNHPPAASRVQLSQAFSFVQYATLATIFFGDSLFQTLNLPPPGLYLQARDNKAWSAFLVFMLGNQLTHSILATGAFEVTAGYLPKRCLADNSIVCTDLVRPEPVFSKLEEGRFPHPDEVISVLDRMMKA